MRNPLYQKAPVEDISYGVDLDSDVVRCIVSGLIRAVRLLFANRPPFLGERLAAAMGFVIVDAGGGGQLERGLAREAAESFVDDWDG